MLLSVKHYRQEELDQLHQQSHHVKQGKMALTVIDGERDIGKDELVRSYADGPAQSIFVELDLTNHSHYVEKILQEVILQLLDDIESKKSTREFTLIHQKLLELIEQLGLTEFYLRHNDPDQHLLERSHQQRQWFLRRDAYISLLQQFLIQAAQLLIHHSLVLVVHLKHAEFGYVELFQFFLDLLSDQEQQPAMHIILSTCNYLKSRISELLTSIEQDRERQLNFVLLKLQPLSKEHIQHLVLSAFPNRGFSSHRLTDLIAEKSGGNPGKIRFMLDLMKEKQLIFLSGMGDDHLWYVDFERAELIVDLGEYYGDSYQFIEQSYCNKKIFVYAACYGAPFTVSLLKAVLPSEIQSMIAPALEKGVKYRLLESVDSKSNAEPTYRFTQFTIVENILRLEHKNQLNLIRMRLFDELVKAFPKREPFGRVSADQLAMLINRVGSVGINYSHIMQRKKLAANLVAGYNHLGNNNVSAASRFLRQAVATIKHRHWHLEYDLAFTCYVHYIRCLYLQESYEACIVAIKYCLQQPLTDVHKGQLYVRWVYALKSLDRHEEAVEKALEGVAVLGFKVSRHPSNLKVMFNYIQCRTHLIQARSSQFQPCRDPKHTPLFKLLELAALSTYICKIELLPYIAISTIRISMTVGYTPFTFACLVAMGINSGVFRSWRPHSMERYYYLGESFLKAQGERSLLREFLYVGYCGPWQMPLNRVVDRMKVLSKEGPSFAEPEEVSVCNVLYFTLAIVRGQNLGDLMVDIQLALSQLEAPKYSTFHRLLRILAQVLSNLVAPLSNSSPTLLKGPYFDEEREFAQIPANDHLTRFTYNIAKLYLSLHFREFEKGVMFGQTCQHYQSGVEGLGVVPVYQYVSALCYIFSIREQGGGVRWRLLKAAPKMMEVLLYFSMLNKQQPNNYGHLYWSFRGIMLYCYGLISRVKSIRYIQKGINIAKREGYFHIVAMGYEMKDQLFYGQTSPSVAMGRVRVAAKRKALYYYRLTMNRAKAEALAAELGRIEEGAGLWCEVEFNCESSKALALNQGQKEVLNEF